MRIFVILGFVLTFVLLWTNFNRYFTGKIAILSLTPATAQESSRDINDYSLRANVINASILAVNKEKNSITVRNAATGEKKILKFVDLRTLAKIFPGDTVKIVLAQDGTVASLRQDKK